MTICPINWRMELMELLDARGQLQAENKRLVTDMLENNPEMKYLKNISLWRVAGMMLQGRIKLGHLMGIAATQSALNDIESRIQVISTLHDLSEWWPQSSGNVRMLHITKPNNNNNHA